MCNINVPFFYSGAILYLQTGKRLINKKGVLRSVSGRQCLVELYDENHPVLVSIENIDPVKLSKYDKVSIAKLLSTVHIVFCQSE